MLPQCHGDADTAEGEGKGAGRGGSDDAHAGAWDQEFHTQSGYMTGRVDQQEIQAHIDDVHPHAYLHGGLGISGSPEGSTENDGSRPGQHGKVEDEEIGGCQIPDSFIYLHPNRYQAAEGQGQDGEEGADDACNQHRLGNGFGSGLLVPGAVGTGNEGQKANAQGRNRAADEPVDGGGGANGGGGVGAQGTDHGGVNILHRRLHQLLQHGGPGQRQDRGDHGGIEKPSFHIILPPERQCPPLL